MNTFARNLGRTVALTSVLVLVCGRPAGAVERGVKASAVPSIVQQAVKARHPDARMVRYTREEEHGTVTYEVTIQVKGKVTDVGVTAEGRIVVEEERIARKELPPEVVNEFAASPYAHAQVKHIERIVEEESRDTPKFEILVKDHNEFIELTFDSSGRLLKQERTRKAD